VWLTAYLKIDSSKNLMLNKKLIKQELYNLSRDFKNLPSAFILCDEVKYNSMIGKLRGIIDTAYSGKEVKVSEYKKGIDSLSDISDYEKQTKYEDGKKNAITVINIILSEIDFNPELLKSLILLRDEIGAEGNLQANESIESEFVINLGLIQWKLKKVKTDEYIIVLIVVIILVYIILQHFNTVSKT